ncbi:Pycsar system effector family protein [Priestia megaterium]
MENEEVNHSYNRLFQSITNDGKIRIETYQREKSTKSTFIASLDNQLNNSLRFADTKAGALIAANGLTAKFISGLDVKGSVLISLLLNIGLLLVLAGVVASLVVVLPRRLRSKDKGIIYWENISNMEKAEYVDTVSELSVDELFERRIENNYYQAKILTKKFSRLRLAFIISIVGYIVVCLGLILNQI